MKHTKKHLVSLVLVSSLLLGGTNSQAAMVGSQYARCTTRAVWYGCEFHNTYGQNELNSNYDIHSSSTAKAFITDEMWAGFKPPAGSMFSSSWIEVGDVDGYIQGFGYWAGSFTAKCYYDPSDYTEYRIGNIEDSGYNTFTIDRKASGSYDFLVKRNGAIYQTFTMPSTIIERMNVGIETDVDNSTFTNGIYSDKIRYKNSSGNWVSWSSAIINTENLNPFGWTATYNSSTNTITYNHR